jgi:hypothetical protein
MASLKASPIGCEIIKARRQEKDWRYRDPRWAGAAGKILLPKKIKLDGLDSIAAGVAAAH